MSARAGERLRHGDAPAGPEAEAMLAVATRAVIEAAARNPALGALGVEGELERLEHEWVPHRGKLIHLESHRVDPAAATIVIGPGLGDHARRQLALAAALAARGFNSLVVDRQGHGLSEGRRGDSPLEADLGVLELAIGLSRSRSTGPVILLGDSLGGIMSWYLLTREPDVEAVVCHCIGHPDVDPDPSFRLKARLIRALGAVTPCAPISIRRIADYDHVSLDPETRRYFDERLDPLFNFTVTARSAASYLGFRPTLAWERVRTPVMVLIGAEDRMVTPEFTRRVLERGRPPRTSYLEVPGAGHQLFLDHLDAVIDRLSEWVRGAVAPRRAAAAS